MTSIIGNSCHLGVVDQAFGLRGVRLWDQLLCITIFFLLAIFEFLFSALFGAPFSVFLLFNSSVLSTLSYPRAFWGVISNSLD